MRFSAVRDRELVALYAGLMALFALSVDVMLPALPVIGQELRVARDNQIQHVVSALVLGMAIGQPFYGPLSERVGRKPAISAGLVLFGVGCIASIHATDLREMLAGRFLQGLGAAGPRIVTVALLRDRFSGPEMARIMSFVIAILMIGPLIAPFLGQGVMLFAHWRDVFLVLLLFDAALLAWLAARHPETLPRSRRMPPTWTALAAAVLEVLRSRTATGYAIAGGIVFGELFAYVSTAPQIYQAQYGVGAWFPLCFSASGVAVAAASLCNARWVAWVGMRRLCLAAAVSKALLAATFLALATATAGHPPLWAILVLVAAFFFCAGILFGNLNALAMEPLGHVAGVAAGIVGSLTWLLAMILAAGIGQRLDGGVTPLAVGFATLSVALLFVTRWAGGGLGNLVRHS